MALAKGILESLNSGGDNENTESGIAHVGCRDPGGEGRVPVVGGVHMGKIPVGRVRVHPSWLVVIGGVKLRTWPIYIYIYMSLALSLSLYIYTHTHIYIHI